MAFWHREAWAPIVGGTGFAVITTLEIYKAARLRYPVSVLAVLPAGVPEPHRLAEQVAEAIRPVIRSTDVIGLRPSSAGLYVLLIDAAPPDVPAISERIRDEVGRHLFQVDGDRKAVTLRLGSACFPTTANTLKDLMAQADTRARKARPKRGRRRH